MTWLIADDCGWPGPDPKVIAVHQLGKFIRELMDAHGMTQSDLARKSGLTRQHVSGLVTNSDLKRMPEPKTFDALAKAFPDIGDMPFITKAAEAVGVPVDRFTTVEPDYGSLTNEALLGILRGRLEAREGETNADQLAEARKKRERGTDPRFNPDIHEPISASEQRPGHERYTKDQQEPSGDDV